MRFLIDMPLTPAVAVFLQGLGHDAVHAANIGAANASDAALLARARAESRVVITADLDFGRLMAEVPANSPGIILLRAGSYSDTEMIDLVQRVLQRVEHGPCLRGKTAFSPTELPTEIPDGPKF